nr:MAG TPA: hypothetical protein [Caudoviricetes sp.]DAO41829.1 MAG TPA: hypothetical protein [Caudoviricetes sp.]DAR89704.1 MAG TPA: hypothetical protein [Caudoviricetes sp.]DAR96735.1 MAG TPA: hypothetical protein [Caudoviricetes sp.]
MSQMKVFLYLCRNTTQNYGTNRNAVEDDD